VSLGYFQFGPSGNVTFWSTSSSLTIGGLPYTLVDSVAMLESDVGPIRRATTR
jgi:hypothetical protein